MVKTESVFFRSRIRENPLPNPTYGSSENVCFPFT